MRSVAMAGLQMGSPGSPSDLAHAVTLPAAGLVWLYAFVTAAVLLDARARREDRFLANLGTSRPAIGGVVVATVTALEVAISVGVRVVSG